MDTFSPEKRSEVMARVRSKDTKPEMAVRRYLHNHGLRYRLHRRDLPGCPDLAFTSRRVAVFIHGCFWHRHPGCRKTTMPASRIEFWRDKFDATVKRDAKAREELHRAGWTVLVIWECEVTPEGLDRLFRQILTCPAP